MATLKEKLSLDGRVAIVTGASVPRGIGKACCVALAGSIAHAIDISECTGTRTCISVITSQWRRKTR